MIGTVEQVFRADRHGMDTEWWPSDYWLSHDKT
jgi:hypothetical protein